MGTPEGKADTDLHCHGRCSWSLFFECISSCDHTHDHSTGVPVMTLAQGKSHTVVLQGGCDSPGQDLGRSPGACGTGLDREGGG